MDNKQILQYFNENEKILTLTFEDLNNLQFFNDILKSFVETKDFGKLIQDLYNNNKEAEGFEKIDEVYGTKLYLCFKNFITDYNILIKEASKVTDIDKEEFENIFKNKKIIIGETFKKEKIPNKTNDEKYEKPIVNNVQDIKNILDKYIIGQENAKKIVSQAVYNHYKVWLRKLKLPEQHTLLIGPSGCGKTKMLRVLKKELKIPVHILDMTNLSFAGYKGNNHLDDKLKDIEDGSIIVLDEFDKIVLKNANQERKDGNLLQSEFLKLLENEKGPKNCLVFLTGTFTDLTRKNNLNIKSNIGFENNQDISLQNDNKISIDDLINYGILNEILGRITFIEELNELTNEDYLAIIKSEKGLYNSYKKEYKKTYGLDISIRKEVLIDLISELKNSRLGARGLNSQLSKIINNALYDLKEKDYYKYKKILIGKKGIKYYPK